MATDPYGVTLDRRANNLQPILNLETYRELQGIFIHSSPRSVNDVPEPFRTWLKNPRRIPDENRRVLREDVNGDPIYVEIDDDMIANVIAR
jgi:hypothetical protein